MEVRVVDSRSKEIAEFNDREWPKADLEHYGAVEKWREDVVEIAAYEKDAIVGTLQLTISRGVCKINALIVAHNAQGKGIGTALMQKAEELAREEHAHKIWLDTGKGWQAEPFYLKLGYTQNTILPNHYFGKDFILFEKMLS
jgi:GNAT superfamily N-acetyltransferase